MDQEEIRIGHLVTARHEDESALGRIESGHAGDWYVRTAEGELTGPWRAADLAEVARMDMGQFEGVPLDEIEHVAYPHEPGRLYDCPRCEAECHCTGFPGHAQCVFCATLSGEAS